MRGILCYLADRQNDPFPWGALREALPQDIVVIVKTREGRLLAPAFKDCEGLASAHSSRLVRKRQSEPLDSLRMPTIKDLTRLDEGDLDIRSGDIFYCVTSSPSTLLPLAKSLTFDPCVARVESAVEHLNFAATFCGETLEKVLSLAEDFPLDGVGEKIVRIKCTRLSHPLHQVIEAFVVNLAPKSLTNIPYFRPMLRWFQNPQGIRVEETDLLVKEALPAYIKCPLKIKIDSGHPSALQEGSEIFQLSSSESPHEMYAVTFPNREVGSEATNEKELILIEPAFTLIFLKYLIKQPMQCQAGASIFLTPKRIAETPRAASQPATLRDTSISLENWTPSQDPSTPLTVSQPSNHPDSIRMANKNMLKKLLLLSLRHVGIDKHHREFSSIWKHLYCGCLFALRRELGCSRIEQSGMLSIIRSNMNFLNIK